MLRSSPQSALAEPLVGFGRGNAMWAALGLVTFAAAMIVAYRPSLDSSAETILAFVPWLLLAGMALAFLSDVFGARTPVKAVGLAIAVVGWAGLIFDDARWSLLAFPVYALCFVGDRRRPLVGLALAGVVTAIWVAAWTTTDTPAWTAIIPGFVFVAGSTIFLAIHRTARMADEQAALVRELRATQQELAASERTRGALEERARMAGEIHDTLAQGFASIVLLSRAAQRSPGDATTIESIEATAEENLDAARRLVGSMTPPELESASLSTAIERHLASVPGDLEARFSLVGTPRQLAGTIEVTLLRAAQEAIRNVSEHARARSVEVTLSYHEDAVSLEVADDGVGIEPGAVADRGTLTGGQGLATMARRAESLSGTMTVRNRDDGGSVVSVLLPLGVPQ